MASKRSVFSIYVQNQYYSLYLMQVIWDKQSLESIKQPLFFFSSLLSLIFHPQSGMSYFIPMPSVIMEFVLNSRIKASFIFSLPVSLFKHGPSTRGPSIKIGCRVLTVYTS